MASYVDTQIAAARKTVADAIAGKGLQQAIRQLQDKAKVGDSLKALPARGAIVGKRQIGKRTAAGGSDFVELSRSFYPALRELRSSDGLFVLEFHNVRQIVMDRGTFTYLDYNPNG